MIKPPKGCKDAVPTPQGWAHPNTGKIIIVRRLANSDIMEYKKYMAGSEPTSAPAPEVLIEADPILENLEEALEPLIEADPVNHDHDSMTKAELAEHAALEHGINLSTSQSKAKMIKDVESQI